MKHETTATARNTHVGSLVYCRPHFEDGIEDDGLWTEDDGLGCYLLNGGDSARCPGHVVRAVKGNRVTLSDQRGRPLGGLILGLPDVVLGGSLLPPGVRKSRHTERAG